MGRDDPSRSPSTDPIKRLFMNFQPIATRITLAAALLLTGFAHAQVSVQDAWVRATVPQQKATGLFMHIDATQDVRLVSGQSPVAGVVEIHEMVTALGGAHDAMSWQRLSGSGIQLCRGVLALFIEPVHTQVASALGIRRP